MLTSLVAVAGGLGAAARLAVDGSLRARWPRLQVGATLAINVSGSLLLGLLVGAVLDHGAPARLRTIGGTGFCGGYTTFSTASLEAVRLAQTGGHGRVAGVAYAVGSWGLCLGAALLGLQL